MTETYQPRHAAPEESRCTRVGFPLSVFGPKYRCQLPDGHRGAHASYIDRWLRWQ